MPYFDNTMIEAYRQCERKFYFRHVRGWVPDVAAMPLIFGKAWHTAMDTVWPTINASPEMPTRDVVELGMQAFLSDWQEAGLPSIEAFLDMSLEEQKKFLPRTPMVAMEMLYCYIEQRRQMIRDCELIAVERPFAVPIDPNDKDLWYCGKLDKVIRQGKKIITIEHKTTTLYKKEGPFQNSFTESFSPNSQVDGYLFSTKMIYGSEVYAVYVDAALVHRDHHDGFRIIPISRLTEALDAWLWQTHRRIASIKTDLALLTEARNAGAQHKYLAAFPQKTEACTLYGNCPYLDVCRMMPNPELYDTPSGFKQEFWSPFDQLHLDKLGLEKDKQHE